MKQEWTQLVAQWALMVIGTNFTSGTFLSKPSAIAVALPGWVGSGHNVYTRAVLTTITGIFTLVCKKFSTMNVRMK